MGIAKQWASDIRTAKEQQEAQDQEVLHRSLLIESGAPTLWEALNIEVEAIIKECCTEVPQAKGLGVNRLNSNNLTVQTIAFPIIKVEILRGPDGYIRSTVTETKHGLAETKSQRSQPIGYTTNAEEVMFSYRGRSLTARELAEELMQPVFAFLKEIALS